MDQKRIFGINYPLVIWYITKYYLWLSLKSAYLKFFLGRIYRIPTMIDFFADNYLKMKEKRLFVLKKGESK